MMNQHDKSAELVENILGNMIKATEEHLFIPQRALNSEETYVI